MPPAPPRENLEDGVRPHETPLGGLIRIGRRADCNGLAFIDFRQLALQNFGHSRFRVDLVFECGGVFFHELVRVAGVAIFAAEFAAAVGIDGPAERHARFGPVQQAARGDLEILHGAFGFENLALRSQLCNPYQATFVGRQFGLGKRVEQQHVPFSPFLRLFARDNRVNFRPKPAPGNAAQ